MAPKKSKKSVASSSAGYDTNKFVSKDAADLYHSLIIKRTIIPERGFDITGGGFPRISRIIVDRGWGRLCAQPNAAVIPVVREFYANGKEHTHEKVEIWGRIVRIHYEDINRYFGVPNIQRDDYIELY